jgi:hypothetical protein
VEDVDDEDDEDEEKAKDSAPDFDDVKDLNALVGDDKEVDELLRDTDGEEPPSRPEKKRR